MQSFSKKKKKKKNKYYYSFKVNLLHLFIGSDRLAENLDKKVGRNTPLSNF